MTYAELLDRLLGARRFGVKLGLDRMEILLARLGHPEQCLGTVIHVGGTNGKGSVVAMIAALATAAGKRVATYTSPHLSTLRERIVVDGAMAGEAEVVAAYERVVAAGGDELTFFEQITAIAFVMIAAANVDVTVLEVGLGGRLDATNVVAAPVAVVTGVAMDHEAILGDTLEQIAAEKAGIFKPGQRIVIGSSGEPAATRFLVDAARLQSDHVELVAHGPATNLLGAHQRTNTAIAVAAVAAAGLPVDSTALLHVTHPGRFERIDDLILDGAHNPHGARALAAAFTELGIRPVLVLAVSADKDVRAIVAAVAGSISAIVATRYQQDRAMEPAELARIANTPHIAPDLASAVALARTLGAPIAIAGSLFLVGEARVLYAGAPADPIRVSDPPATSR
ncbi:MAG TPA: Mur ligase family protein [Kofleriaceae bacterium]